jgi:hypothetical protein
MRVRPVKPVFMAAGGVAGVDYLRGVLPMSDLRKAAEQALIVLQCIDYDSFDTVVSGPDKYMCDDAYDALRAALAQPEQGPVLHKWAALFEDPNNDWQAGYEHARRWVFEVGLQSIAAPPQRKPLRTVIYACPICAASLERQE